MDVIPFLLRKRFQKPVKTIPALLGIGADQADIGAVPGAQLLIVNKLIHFYGRYAVLVLPL